MKLLSLKKITKTQITLLSTIFIILILIFFYYNIDSDEGRKKTIFIISQLKDTFQIIFFIVVGVLTFLSYRQAKKTLFTPIKTETFKIQIKTFEEVLIFFQNKSEIEFNKQFDLNLIVFGNAHFLLNNYINIFFKNELKPDEEKLKELKSKFKYGAVSLEYMQENFTRPEYHEKPEIKKQEDVTNPALILKKWMSYKYQHIRYTEKYNEEEEKLNQLIASPLLPLDIKKLLEKFQVSLKENLTLVGEVLSEISQELPEKFPNKDSINRFDPSGIWNEYNHKKKNFEPIAHEILLAIRDYLQIDSLTK